LRLQDVAAAAGVSHPTILHHFGSREGLIRALNGRAVESLKTALLDTMGDNRDGRDGIAISFAAYRHGLAQRMMWLLQSSVTTPPPQGLAMFEEIVQAFQAARLRHAKPGTNIDIQDTRAIVHLVTIAAFGDALIGPRLRQTSGAAEKAASRAFEQWFSGLIERHIRGTAQG
jgi:AcrR family transcriptional regulator